MASKKRKTGIPILLMGSIVFGQQLTRIDYDAIRTVDYLLLGSSLVFISIGFYALYKSTKDRK